MGAGINEQFSDNPMYNIFGTVTGTVTCTQFPSGSAKLLRFKADPDNEGNFLLGAFGSGEGCVWPMAAGDDTGWIAPPTFDYNLAGLQNYTYQNLSGTSELLYYWIQK